MSAKIPGQAKAENHIKVATGCQDRNLTLPSDTNDRWSYFVTNRSRKPAGLIKFALQAASRGHPILGDVLYGSEIPFGEQHEDARLRTIALHAKYLQFYHPMNQEKVKVEAPMSRSWQAILTNFSPKEL